jgi:hypothetical protein
MAIYTRVLRHALLVSCLSIARAVRSVPNRFEFKVFIVEISGHACSRYDIGHEVGVGTEGWQVVWWKA